MPKETVAEYIEDIKNIEDDEQETVYVGAVPTPALTPATVETKTVNLDYLLPYIVTKYSGDSRNYFVLDTVKIFSDAYDLIKYHERLCPVEERLKKENDDAAEALRKYKMVARLVAPFNPTDATEINIPDEKNVFGGAYAYISTLTPGVLDARDYRKKIKSVIKMARKVLPNHLEFEYEVKCGNIAKWENALQQLTLGLDIEIREIKEDLLEIPHFPNTKKKNAKEKLMEYTKNKNDTNTQARNGAVILQPYVTSICDDGMKALPKNAILAFLTAGRAIKLEMSPDSLINFDGLHADIKNRITGSDMRDVQMDMIYKPVQHDKKPEVEVGMTNPVIIISSKHTEKDLTTGKIIPKPKFVALELSIDGGQDMAEVFRLFQPMKEYAKNMEKRIMV